MQATKSYCKLKHKKAQVSIGHCWKNKVEGQEEVRFCDTEKERERKKKT
jgi:hypothetical protein